MRFNGNSIEVGSGANAQGASAFAPDVAVCGEVIHFVEQAPGYYHRLLFVVGPFGSGKTALLHRTAQDLNVPLLNVNLELSRLLLDLTQRQRLLQLPRLLDDIVSATGKDVVLLDNLEMLFDRAFGQDPLALIQSLSRNRTLIVSWNGTVDDGWLVYGAPEHPEYRRYPTKELMILDLSEHASHP
jgi:DNA replication protein DnaC